jgi:hypothetical protein
MLRRWWVPVLSLLVAGAVTVVLVVGIGQGTRHEVAISAGGGRYGFVVQMRIEFASGRTVVSGSFHADGRDFRAGFYNDDGPSDDQPPLPMHVDGGDHLLVHAPFSPSCEEGLRAAPVLTVVSLTGDGSQAIDRFTATNSPEYVAAARRWCGLAIHGAVLGATLDQSHREASFRVQLFNTTASPVRVVSKPFQNASTHWARASIVVPPRGRSLLTVSVSGPRWSPRPWNLGLLEANGQVIQLGR